MKKIIASAKQERLNVCLLILAVTVFLIILPQFASHYAVILSTEVFIYSIFALSLNLLIGYVGLPSLGHAAFFGAGSYTIAILVVKGGIDNFWLCLPVALLVTTKEDSSSIQAERATEAVLWKICAG